MKLNKLLFVLLSVALSLGFTSCSDDDDDVDNNEFSKENIVGTWVYSKVSVEVETGNPLLNPILNKFLSNYDVLNMGQYSYVFNENNTYIEKEYKGDSEGIRGTYRLNENNLYLLEDKQEKEFNAFLLNGSLSLTETMKNKIPADFENIDFGIISDALNSINVNPEDIVFKTIIFKTVYTKTELDDSNESDTNTIIGTWTSFSKEIIFVTDNEIVSQIMSDVFTEDAEVLIWTFNEDKSFEYTWGSEKFYGTYRLDDTKLYIMDDEGDEEISDVSFFGKDLIINTYEETNKTIYNREPFNDTAQYDKIKSLVLEQDNTINFPDVIIKSISHKIIFKKD